MSKRLHVRYPQRGKSASPGRTENIRARFQDRHSLEEISRLFQVFIAELEQRGVKQVDGCSLYFAAYDERGGRLTFPNEWGEPLKVMTIGYKRPTAPKTGVPEVSCSYSNRSSSTIR